MTGGRKGGKEGEDGGRGWEREQGWEGQKEGGGRGGGRWDCRTAHEQLARRTKGEKEGSCRARPFDRTPASSFSLTDPSLTTEPDCSPHSQRVTHHYITSRLLLHFLPRYLTAKKEERMQCLPMPARTCSRLRGRGTLPLACLDRTLQ